jgi:hypothetical protein
LFVFGRRSIQEATIGTHACCSLRGSRLPASFPPSPPVVLSPSLSFPCRSTLPFPFSLPRLFRQVQSDLPPSYLPLPCIRLAPSLSPDWIVSPLPFFPLPQSTQSDLHVSPLIVCGSGLCKQSCHLAAKSFFGLVESSCRRPVHRAVWMSRPVHRVSIPPV